MDGSFMLDHNYEFDAPKHVDFGRLDEGEVANDSWFDRHTDDSEDIPLEPENQPGPDMSTVAQNLISNAIGSHSRPASVVPPVTETTEEARVPGEDAVDGIERGPSVEKSIVTENAEHMKETDNHESSAIGKSLEENSCPEVVKSQIPPEPSDSADGSSEAQTSVAEASKNDSIKKNKSGSATSLKRRKSMKKDMYGNTLQVKRFKPLKEPVKMPEPRVPIPFNEAGMMASVLAIEANIIAGRQPITLTIPRTPNAARPITKKKRRSTLVPGRKDDFRQKLAQQRKTKLKAKVEPVKAVASFTATMAGPSTRGRELRSTKDLRLSRPPSPALHTQSEKGFEQSLRNYPAPSPGKPENTKLQPFNLSNRTRRSSSSAAENQKDFRSAAQMAKDFEQTLRSNTPAPDNKAHGSCTSLDTDHSTTNHKGMSTRRPLTHVEPFAFQTDERSVKRKIFEEEVMMKNAAYEELRQERQAEKLAKEELEIKRMREETVHKAQPVPKPKPFEVKMGLIPVTVPESPRFTLRNRQVAKGKTPLKK